MIANGEKGAERLRCEILEEARRQSDSILRDARARADEVVARAEADAEKAAVLKRQSAHSEAARRRSSILSTVAVLANRRRLARIEELLEQIRGELLAGLGRSKDDRRREALVSLAAQALTRMQGDAFVLRLSPRDLDTLGFELSEDIRHRWARPWLKLEVTGDSDTADGQWNLQDETGHQIWELGLESRLARLWPELRRQIAAQLGFTNAEPGKANGS